MCVSEWLHFHLGTRALLALKAHFYHSKVKKAVFEIGKDEKSSARFPRVLILLSL